MEDIYDAVMKIINYTKDMRFDDFMQDEKTIDAVVRNFEIIGEAANRIPDGFKTEHPQIEWRRIIVFATVSFMNILVLIMKISGK